MEWKPIEEMPDELKDGREILLRCVFDDAVEYVAACWRDNPAPAGPYGKFSWRDYQDGAIAEDVPTHYTEITPPEQA